MQNRDREHAKLDASIARQRQLEQEQSELVHNRLRFDFLRESLHTLSDKLFDEEAFALFPILETLHWELAVQVATRKLIPFEIDRERRARRALKLADKNIQDCIRYIRFCLNVGLKIGVPQNNKHHLKLMSGSALSMTSQILPSLLNCKSSLGDFFLSIAQARVRQKLVRPAPQFELVDLSRLPGRSKDKALNELAVYASLEKSYGECQHCRYYVANEIRVSFAREKALQQRQNKMDASIEAAKEDVRAAQNTVLLSYSHGLQETHNELEKLYGVQARIIQAKSEKDDVMRDNARDASDASWDAHQNEATQGDDTSTRPSTLPPYPSSDQASTTIKGSSFRLAEESTGLHQASSARLHTLLGEVDAQTRVEDTDEDLPWHDLALSW